MLAETLEIGAELRPARHRCSVSIGGVSVALNSVSPAHLELPGDLQHFAQDLSACDIEILVTNDVWLDHPECNPVFDSSAVWKLFEDDAGLIFDFSSPLMGSHPYKRLRVDREFSEARLSFHSGYGEAVRFLTAFEYPLDELLVTNRLATTEGVEVHACGVLDPSGGAHLFVGHSGAGKSTTARLWSNLRNATILSDDRIILRLKEGQLWMHGTPWHGEAGFAAAAKAPVKALFVLEHGTSNQITALPQAEAAAELFARSFVPFHDPQAIATTLALLQRIVEQVPVHRYRFLPGSAAVDLIASFHG